jgi:hypothetical protein
MSLLAAAGLLGGSVLGSLLTKKKDTTVTQGPMETPEQAAARKKLLELGTSDPSYTGQMNSYTPTAAESAGQNKLLSVLNSGAPEAFGLGTSALKDLYSTNTFDPYSETGTFAGFKKNVLKEGADASSTLMRNAAVVGNLYGTNTIKDLGKVESNVTDQLSSKLADLYSTYTQNKINNIPTAINAGVAENNMNLGQVQAASQYGSLDRMLQDQQYQDAYNEFVRAQGVKTGALTAVSGQPQYGVSSYTLPGDEGPWGRVLDSMSLMGGAQLGNYLGGG